MSDAPPAAPAQTPAQPAQAPSQVTVTVYQGPPLETIRNLVATRFTVKDAFLDPYGIPTIQVELDKQTRQKFQDLLKDLAPHQLIAILRKTGESLTLRAFPKQQARPSRKWINLALFFITVATVFGSGAYLWSTADPVITSLVETSDVFTKAGMFTAGLLAIIGLHEFGHKAATNYHKLDATLPYFIPGPPPIGTFGALISLKGPPTNRDQLFDLGLSGPVVGFIVTIVVTILSIAFGATISAGVAQQLQASGKLVSSDWSSVFPACLASNGGGCEPILMILISNFAGLFVPANTQGFLIFNSQLWLAAHIGALLTFLNIVPAWQLDGGHISRAVFGPSGHRIATMIGLVLLFGAGYWAFAFLLLVMMSFTRRGFAGVEPLDDVSALSLSRKAAYLVAIAMLVLTFVPSVGL